MTDNVDQPIIDDNPIPEQVVSPVVETPKPAVIQETVSEITKEPVTRKKQKVTCEFAVNNPVKLTSGDELMLPTSFDEETRKVLNDLPNVKFADNPESREWLKVTAEGLSYNTHEEAFVPTLEDETADFHQKMENNGVTLMAGAPRFKEQDNQNLKGERAVIRLITHLGMGTIFQVPLWHSGIWLTFKPPTESEIVELNRLLISDKIKFGRHSYGLVYSNVTVFMIDKLVDFAISHTYDITAKNEDINISNLKEHISCQDIPSLLWGFICTMYPRGFKYRRACIATPDKCNHIVEETLNVSKLQWTNNNAFTDWQKVHMSTRQPRSKDLATINRYKEELNRIQKKKVTMSAIGDREVSFTLKTPTVAQYINAGHRWINDIVETVEKAVGADFNKVERDNLIIKHGQASAMRQYAHWVDTIEYGTNIIDDRETVDTTLDILSSDDEIRTKFIKEVISYINSSTASVIGIPAFDCPACGTPQETNVALPISTNIIPLDVVQLFFGLVTQRLSRLTER